LAGLAALYGGGGVRMGQVPPPVVNINTVTHPACPYVVLAKH